MPHALPRVTGLAEHNGPRSGLEAMASGVPVVVQNAWGWREMVRHGRTGFLASSDHELAYYAARLAYDEDLRLRMATRARRALEDELANPDVLWAAWRNVFASLGSKR
jgi:glycosyltransferase involved in cell wall biosynthesis